MGYPPPAYYSYRDYLPPVHYGYGGIHHLRIIGQIPQSGFRAGMRTQMGKATMVNTTDLTRQGECLAMYRAGSDQGL